MAVAEILTIGNEILDGRVTDTNRVYLGKRLTELGYELRYAQSVDDNLERVVQALELAASRSDLIVCTGGLGPTTDDLTAEAASKFLNCPFEVNTKAEAFIRRIFSERNREINESQMKQAKLPSLCEMLSNPIGTAPGFSYRGPFNDKPLSLYFFPGIPKEMHPMFESAVLQDSLARGGELRKHTWSTLFTSEGDMQEKLRSLEKSIAPFKIGFRTHFPENHISLMGVVSNPDEEKKWLIKRSELDQVLLPFSYNVGKEKDYEELLLEKLVANKVQLIFVESCTAGLISHLLTEVSGSSEVLWGSQVCYANEEKFRLGVDPEIVRRHGAVSSECAEAMALAGLNRLKKDTVKNAQYRVCVSTSGIAGPNGGSELKPVGLMYMSLAVENVSTGNVWTATEKVQAPRFFERKAMKLYFAKKALEHLRVNFLLKPVK
jgi:nicotinamide-nucleotide amidase